jgi:hypothetical protein
MCEPGEIVDLRMKGLVFSVWDAEAMDGMLVFECDSGRMLSGRGGRCLSLTCVRSC